MTRERIKRTMKYRLKKLLNYFLKGLLVALPVILTYKVVSSIVIWVDELIPIHFGPLGPGTDPNQQSPSGLGFVIVIIGVTLVGWIGSSIISRPLFNLMDDFLSNLPFIKVIYTSVKDLMEAFVGEKKKFSKPVIVEFTSGVYKPGFITQEDLSELHLPGVVGVYCPHSYAFSGNLFFVDKSKIKIYEGNATDFMKFIVSGGVTEID